MLSPRAPLLACLIALSTASAGAEEAPALEFEGSGFLSLAVGKMLSGTKVRANDTECPCFISDYAQTGVYDGRNGLQWKPDSRLGLQGTVSLPDAPFSLTGQIVARGAQDGEVNLEWLYANYKFNETFTLQAGRKRLPMFYYSDAQDVGYALPWTHLPPQLYGWDVVNYNGVNLMWKKPLGESWHLAGNVLAGSESVEESGYWKMYWGPDNRTDVRWDNLLGGDVTLANDWLELRFSYIQSRTKQRNVTGSWDEDSQSYDPLSIDAGWANHARQRIHGLALNVDRNNWLLKSEIIYIDRPGDTFRDRAQILAVGHRFGSWQPLLTWSHYKTMTRIAAKTEAHTNLAATLRYEVDDSSAVKVQLDFQKGQSDPAYDPQYGDARLLTVSYDRVF